MECSVLLIVSKEGTCHIMLAHLVLPRTLQLVLFLVGHFYREAVGSVRKQKE